MKVCGRCAGAGYNESPRYYYGRVECGACGGIGKVKDDGTPYLEVCELEADSDNSD